MNLLQYKTSLNNKLSILTALAVMLVVIALGFYFDNFLKNNSLANAHSQISHSYQRLASNLKDIEVNLKEGVKFIQSDEQISASVELINNYQDKNNYNSYLIDEEKKLISNLLLSQVKYSFNDDIALYDVNDDLIAFVTKDKKGFQLNYITYINSEKKLLNRYEQQQKYTTGNIEQQSPNISLHHVNVYDPNIVNRISLITYHKQDDNIVIKSHQNITDKITKQAIGHIEISRILDEAYFLELSQALNIDIKHSFNSSLDDRALLLNKNINKQNFNISQNKEKYSAILKQSSLNGEIYYLINLNKASFNSLLNANRTQLLIILILVTISISILMRYIINFSLARPLSELMQQINKIEHQDYSASKPITTGDELEAVSENINQLAQTLQERENSLKISLDSEAQLSKQVKESEAQLYTLIRTLPDLVWLKDAEGVYQSCNKKFERFFGANEMNIVGKTDYDFVDKEMADTFRENDKKAMTAGRPTTNEEKITYADDGHTEYVETIKTPMFDDNGKVTGVLGIARDITERKNIEEKLRKSSSRLEKIASRVPGMVYQYELTSDGKMRFPYISEAIKDLYHVSATEVQKDSSKIFDKTHPDDVEKLNNSILESARTLKPWKIEYRICDQDGSIRWLYGNSIPEVMPDGGTLWHGFVTDITKQKESDETLRRTQKMDALGKLTGGIAHDYNNMLGVVLGYADLLKEMLAEQPDLQSYADQIIHASERGAKLTKKLLSFSRQKPSDANALDINQVLIEEQHMLEKTLTARIQLELKLEEDPWQVYLDESELEDAILNLCINSMHAIENSGILTIETKNKMLNAIEAESLELNPDEYVQLIISDTGHGMDQLTKDKIFDPFYSTKGELGTGLGLSQVYGFIKRCGGAVKVESQLNIGTQFNLYFPRYFGQDTSKSELKENDKITSSNEKTILVVDDELQLLNLAGEILNRHGYKVFCAQHANDALKILETESIDIMFSDVIMPDIDGYELAAITREKYPNVKIQLASGYTGEHHTKYVNAVLTNNLLQKPYNSQSLLNKIQSL